MVHTIADSWSRRQNNDCDKARATQLVGHSLPSPPHHTAVPLLKKQLGVWGSTVNFSTGEWAKAPAVTDCVLSCQRCLRNIRMVINY